MNSKLYTILIILIFVGCSRNIENSLNNKVEYDYSLKDSFFFVDKWSYPSFTTKDMDGKFDTAIDGKVDTSHLYHSSNIVMLFDSLNNKEMTDYSNIIRYGEAHIIRDTILLEFSESTPSSDDYLKITINNKRFTSIYIGGYPWTNFYEFEKQKLILYNAPYKLDKKLEKVILVGKII
jgi:hypothetical protein